MKTILVPTDFSENANQAFFYAMQIAQGVQAEIVVLHTYHVVAAVTDPLLPQAMYDTMADTLSEQAHSQMKLFQESVTPELRIPCRFETHIGMTVDVILHKAYELEADLIVMGTKGNSGMIGHVLGSITSALIQRHTFPVLAVPLQAVWNPWQTVVFGTDYQEIHNPSILQPLKDIVLAFQAKIHVLNANPVPEKMSEEEYIGEEQLEILLHNYNVCFDYSDEADVERALTQCVHDEKASMLVMIAHQRNFWQGLFHRSLTRSMALHTHVPLLILPDVARA